MRNETHYTSKAGAVVNGKYTVHRRADYKHVGTITKLHRGWEANLGAGIRKVYATKAEAFAAFTK